MQKKWIGIGCLSVLIVIILFFYGTSRMLKGITKNQKKVTENSWLVLDLKGMVNEHSLYEDDMFGLSSVGISDVMNKLAQASSDEKIKGIIIKPKSSFMGMAQVNEFHHLIREFKASGKPVVAYINTAVGADYFLCSAADEIWLNPSSSAGIVMNEVGATAIFYKDLLAKVGVKVNVIHAGKYKSAGDSFSRTTMSPAMKESYTAVFKERYEKLKLFLSQSREITPEQAADIYEKRESFFIKGNYAKESGLVDELGYEGDLFDKYGVDENKLIKISEYGRPQFPYPGDKVAIVYAEGAISAVSSGTTPNISSKKLNKVLDKLSKDDSIKAIVLRVNSPGGSSLESDIIAQRIKMLKEKKPVIVSMGSVAASGGYYISAPCDYIYADPFTITGSIGVIMMFPDVSELGKDLGIKTETISFTKFHGVNNIWSKRSPKMLESLDYEVNAVYDEFKTVVANGRKMSMQDVEKYAQGRIWGADLALKNGLIDEVGSLGNAVNKAAELGGIGNYTIQTYPKKKSIFEYFIDNKDSFFPMSLMNENGLRAKLLKKAKQIEQMLQEHQIYMMMPYEIDFE